MCGICGIINFNDQPVQESSIRTMMQKMKHRGPDDDGVFLENNIGMGFVRLSILDLSRAGHQPMFSTIPSFHHSNIPANTIPNSENNARYVIVYNGEVYNYVEMREELKAKGYRFQSNTDTEVVLNAYIEWGEECLHKFNGMWAFAIYNRQSKELFIARDRYGVKPLYYYLDNEIFIFASEIPPILDALHAMRYALRATPNYQAIFDYLVFNRTDQTEQTFFDGIKKLQHGHQIRLTIDDFRLMNKGFEIQKWYELKERVKAAQPFGHAMEYRELFSSAVGLRLRSDVPVGVCLSGGLDSSSIVSTLLQDYQKKDLNTFSAIYGAGKRGDESLFIHEYRPHLPNMFFTTPDANTLFADMKSFVRAHGEPIPSTAPYAQYKVMELAQKNVVVTLDGQGADEQLAGYHYFFGYYYKDLLRQFRLVKLLDEVRAYLKLHRSCYGLQTFLYFLLPATLKTSARVGEKGYLNPQFVRNYSANNSIASNLYGSASLNQALIDHFEYKLEHLLKWEDRNSMFFSLESRVPFLDYRLVERTLSVSSDQIINRGWTKHILRQSMQGILPENIRLRKDKVGFLTPEDDWFREEHFQKFILDLIGSESFIGRGIIDHDTAKLIYQKHLNKKVQASKEIWKWIHLELWFREFID